MGAEVKWVVASRIRSKTDLPCATPGVDRSPGADLPRGPNNAPDEYTSVGEARPMFEVNAMIRPAINQAECRG
jgi:hypothetical protein